jgi:shikimate dehydrogenase
MATSTSRSIQGFLANRLGPEVSEATWLVGLLGEGFLRQERGISLWNPLLRSMEIDACYAPFAVEPDRLAAFLKAVRHDERLKGFNVTAPYKQRIVPLLDGMDSKARSIGSVDTVVRDPCGRLVGSNTEGSGCLAGLTARFPGGQGPFIDEPDGLQGLSVLLLGAGCAGGALAWYLAEAIGSGRLHLANRTKGKAQALCDRLRTVAPSTTWVEETALDSVIPKVHLIINTTTKGQPGFWTLADGTVTCLEPYSSLAQANPVSLPADSAQDAAQFYNQWYRASLPDIVTNIDRSVQILASLPMQTRFVDLIVSPVESVMLRQARLAGHRTMGGKGLLICQAADAFFHQIFRDHFEQTGRYEPSMYQTIIDRLWEAW